MVLGMPIFMFLSIPTQNKYDILLAGGVHACVLGEHTCALSIHVCIPVCSCVWVE